MLRIYNTLTRSVEEFNLLDPPNVGMYSCGPTVYDYAHIGHFRTYVNTDVLHRTLEYFGLTVNLVMNITDVGHLTSDADTGEDKMEKGAAREGKSVWDIAKFYTDDYFDALAKLNIKKTSTICKATDHIPEMIALIQKLEKKGFTYRINDGIYFDTSKFSDYGKLTGQDRSELKAGARVEMVPGKKSPIDFALWKFSPPSVKRQMEWESPWGKGFPGWHIECSAMSMKYLGESFDIHTGGVDHIAIHHTNEIAQSEAATGKPFVRYWVHHGFLTVDGKKMSKSLGNFYSQHDIEKKGYSLMDARYLFLTAHYRDPMSFTWQSLESSAQAYRSLRSLVSNLARTSQERITLSEGKLRKLDMFRSQFQDALESDLAIPSAVATLWQVAKSSLPSGDKRELILDFDQVLGLRLGEEHIIEMREIPEEVTKLVNQREQLRKENLWKEADVVRQEVEEKGYAVEDTPSGPKVVKK